MRFGFTMARRRDRSIRSKKPPRLTLYRCPAGHVHFNRDVRCPECGHPLNPARTLGRGVLLTHTRTAVTPSGQPQKLGIVRWRGGSRTLCRIIGDVRGLGWDRVWLIRMDGLYHAFGKSGRRWIPRIGFRRMPPAPPGSA